jgi:hypothetical protein
LEDWCRNNLAMEIGLFDLEVCGILLAMSFLVPGGAGGSPVVVERIITITITITITTRTMTVTAAKAPII